jgi:hypothetical protein
MTGFRETEYEIVEDGILTLVLAHRRVGEDAYETARRLLTHEALERAAGHQMVAAEVLHVSTRVINYHAATFQLRPRDRRTA